MPRMPRIDPTDGAAYTFPEMNAFYSQTYTKDEIMAYWGACTPEGKGKGKTKAKAKARAAVQESWAREGPTYSVKRVGDPKRKPADPEEVLKRLAACKVVPVIKVDDAEHAAPLVTALQAGGIDVAEITFRTACAAQAIHKASAVEGICVGAGTVLEAKQVDEAVNMGADFIISPGFSLAVLNRCNKRGVLYMPAACTPTEVMTLIGEHKLKTLKFFPAGNFGGAGTLKSFGAVFQGIKFMPTGGVTESNISDYLGLPNVIAAGGTWFIGDGPVKKAAESGSWGDITEAAKKAKAAADAARP